jgi:hypothetical protein
MECPLCDLCDLCVKFFLRRAVPSELIVDLGQTPRQPMKWSAPFAIFVISV